MYENPPGGGGGGGGRGMGVGVGGGGQGLSGFHKHAGDIASC